MGAIMINPPVLPTKREENLFIFDEVTDLTKDQWDYLSSVRGAKGQRWVSYYQPDGSANFTKERKDTL